MNCHALLIFSKTSCHPRLESLVFSQLVWEESDSCLSKRHFKTKECTTDLARIWTTCQVQIKHGLIAFTFMQIHFGNLNSIYEFKIKSRPMPLFIWEVKLCHPLPLHYLHIHSLSLMIQMFQFRKSLVINSCVKLTVCIGADSCVKKGLVSSTQNSQLKGRYQIVIY